MVNKILTASGIQYRETRWVKPPAGSYAVFMDDVTVDGPDYYNRIYGHEVTVELYEPAPDPEAEAALEAAITTEGLHYTKQDRVWIQEEQLYMIVYEFTYYEKRRT